MKNITLSVDEEVLDAVRIYAAERRTSVNGLVREYLSAIADHRRRAKETRARIAALSRMSTAVLGTRNWTRNDLHER